MTMPALHRVTRALAALAFAASLAACGTASTPDLDLGGMLDFLDTKKPLPGERKPVFTEGVPGVERGIPKELMKGYQPEPDPALQAQPAEPAKQRAEPEPRKPAKRVASKPKAKPGAAPNAAPGDPPEDDVWPPPPGASRPANQSPAPPSGGAQAR